MDSLLVSQAKYARRRGRRMSETPRLKHQYGTIDKQYEVRLATRPLDLRPD